MTNRPAGTAVPVAVTSVTPAEPHPFNSIYQAWSRDRRRARRPGPRSGERTDDRGTIVSIATKLRLDPELAELVERARDRAASAGEMTPPRVGRIASPLSQEAQRLVRDWLDDGGYDSAIREIAAEDPELANQ